MKREKLNAFAHGDEFTDAVEFFAVGGAVGFFGGEGFGARFGGAKAAFNLFDTSGEGDKCVGKRILDVVWIGDEDALAVAIDNMGGNADDGGVGGNVVENHRAGSDPGIGAYGDIAEDVGIVSYENAIAEGGVALAVRSEEH